MLFIAGHETTSHALEWGLHYLAQNPGIHKSTLPSSDSPQTMSRNTPMIFATCQFEVGEQLQVIFQFQLIWVLILYSEIQQVARDEVDKQLKGETPNGDNIKALSYLDMFIKEGKGTQ